MYHIGIRLRLQLAFLSAAIGLAGSLCAQTGDTREYSTFDVTAFGGYQNFHALRSRPDHTFVDGPFGGLRLEQDFWRHLGIEEVFGFGLNNLRLKNVQPYPVRTVGAQVRNYQASIGPLYHFTPRQSKIRPYVRVGFGATWYQPSNGAKRMFRDPANAFLGVQQFHMSYGPAGFYGIGVKLNTWSRVGMRFDVGGMITQTPHFKMPSFPRGPGSVYIARGGTEHVIQATFGLTFRTRIRSDYVPPPPAPPPPPPPPKPPEIQLSPISGLQDVCPGTAVTATAQASGLPPDVQPTYQWKLNGTTVGQNAPTVSIPTTGLSGTQTVEVTVSAPGAAPKTATGTFNIRPAAPPTVTLSGLPATVNYGDKVPLNATATGSECCGTPKVTYTVSEGTLTDSTFDSTSVQFDMSNRSKQQTRTVHVVATATDTCGNTSKAEGDITVTLNPEARRLDDLVFPRGSTRVNNCAKRLLIEELTPMLRDSPNSRVVLIGHRDERERDGVDRARVLNAAAVLSAGTGICPQLDLSRVLGAWVGTDQSSTPRPALCGASTAVRERGGQAVAPADSRAQFRRVEVWFVPEGAELPAALQSAQPVPADAVKPLGCPK
jgi:hypothetical protein